MTITEKAKQYSDQFVSGTRADGTTYVYLKTDKNDLYDSESDLYKSIREVHGDRFPNDWIYGTYADLMQKITEYDLDTIDDLENVRDEIVDSYIDIYTSDLTKWLASDINNVYYITEALETYGSIEDGFQLLAYAQDLAISEVMSEVVSLLSK